MKGYLRLQHSIVIILYKINGILWNVILMGYCGQSSCVQRGGGPGAGHDFGHSFRGHPIKECKKYF